MRKHLAMTTHNDKRTPDPDLYRIAAEQTKDYAVFLLDTDGRILTWNLGAERIKGYAPDEIIGRHFSTFYTREANDSGWPAHELKVAAGEGRFEDEGWRVRKDGSRFWANVVITALRDQNGKLVAYSKITRDLTDRKLHDEALRQSEERFRLLIEGVVDYAIYMLDSEGVVTSWNKGAQRIKGYSRDEIIGKHFSRFYPQEDIDAGKPWEELAIARREGRAEEEGWRIRKNGDRFWARVIVTPLNDSDGRLRGFAKVTQDLSERRHLQDLEKAAKNVNEFIALLAHELRNPLAPIRNAVHVMAKAPAGDPIHESMRQMIGRQSAQLGRILDDMVDISRVTRGTLYIERLPVDLAEVVRRAVETATPSVEAGKHILDVDLPPKKLIVDGDADRLTQLLANLLNNSARYTPPGGSISVRARAKQSYAVLRVRDSGQGIEPGMIDRIFDMFIQGRTALERIGGGIGVGLALARKIAELHGGSLEAHSEGANKGSEFTLRIPLSKSAQSSHDKRAHTPPTPTAEPLRRQRVLVVDDNVDAATALNLFVQSLGHETCVVYDGLEALKMAVEFRPDIVLLDIGMPGLDGYEVARRLRALKKDRTFRIVAVTGWGQEEDRQRSREAGFDLHLVKPVDHKKLLQVLSERNGATLH
jgi:PAS domain S-box-containing protein